MFLTIKKPSRITHCRGPLTLQVWWRTTIVLAWLSIGLATESSSVNAVSLTALDDLADRSGSRGQVLAQPSSVDIATFPTDLIKSTASTTFAETVWTTRSSTSSSVDASESLADCQAELVAWSRLPSSIYSPYPPIALTSAATAGSITGVTSVVQTYESAAPEASLPQITMTQTFDPVSEFVARSGGTAPAVWSTVYASRSAAPRYTSAGYPRPLPSVSEADSPLRSTSTISYVTEELPRVPVTRLVPVALLSLFGATRLLVTPLVPVALLPVTTAASAAQRTPYSLEEAGETPSTSRKVQVLSAVTKGWDTISFVADASTPAKASEVKEKATGILGAIVHGLQLSKTSPTSLPSPVAIWTGVDITLTAVRYSDHVLVHGQTLSSGAAIVINGETVSNIGSAIVVQHRETINGASAVNPSTKYEDRLQTTLNTQHPIIFVAADATITAASNGVFVLGSQTLVKGSAITAGGTTYSLDQSVSYMMINGKTTPLSLPTSSASSRPGGSHYTGSADTLHSHDHLGQLIWTTALLAVLLGGVLQL